jgi:hypothetical protein
LLRDGWGAKIGYCGIALYVTLALHADNKSQTCWPSYEKLADLTGMSRNRAIMAVKTLERYNLIRVVHRSRHQTNCYVLLHPDHWGDNLSTSRSVEVVNQEDHLGEESQPGRPPGVNRSDHLGNGSHNGGPGGVNEVDSNKTQEQHPQEEQDQFAVDDSLAATWNSVLFQLSLQTTKPTFYTYLSRTRAIDQKNGVLTVAVPNDRIRELCAIRLLRLIERSLRDVTGEDLAVEFQVVQASGHVGQ